MATRCRSHGVHRVCPRAHLHGATVWPRAYTRRQTTRHRAEVTIAVSTTRRAGGVHDHVGIPDTWLRPAGCRLAAAPLAAGGAGRDAWRIGGEHGAAAETVVHAGRARLRGGP